MSDPTNPFQDRSEVMRPEGARPFEVGDAVRVIGSPNVGRVLVAERTYLTVEYDTFTMSRSIDAFEHVETDR